MRCLLITSLLVVMYVRVTSTSECVGLTDDQVTKLKQNKVKEKVSSKIIGEYTGVWVPKSLGENVKCAEEKYYMANDVLRKSTKPIFKDDGGDESGDESKHKKKHKSHKKKKKHHDEDEEGKEKSKEKSGEDKDKDKERKDAEVKDKDKEKKDAEVKDKEKKGSEVKDKEKKGSEVKQEAGKKGKPAENKDHNDKEKKPGEGKEKEINKGTDDKKGHGEKEDSEEHKKESSGENNSGHKHGKKKHGHKNGKKHCHKHGKKKHGRKLKMFEVEDGVFEVKKRHKTGEKMFMVYASNNVFAYVSCDTDNADGKKKEGNEHEKPPVRSFIILKKGKTVDDSDTKADYSEAKKKMDSLGVEITKEMVQLTEKC